ncbi:ATP-binding protein [Mesobacillus harenae]|uniref:ATP-binding protein n=1 Tax=Mesobacillus harenae TaxID=2213203 RepID=UPI00157FEB78|nr:ATP-binding protein [Mesobacillus harenae]
MKSFKDLLSQGGGTRFSQRVVETKMCPHNNQMLELRETTKINKDGESTVHQQWTECLCEVATATKKRQVELKVEQFDRYTTQNPDLEHASLNDFQYSEDRSQMKALQKAINYIERFVPNNGKKLYFFGDVGVGKSHLAISIHKEIKEKGFTSIYLEMDKIMRIIKDTWSKNSEETEGEFFKVLQEVDLLVIDDLGAEHNSQWVQEKLFSILNSRMGRNTIFTSNLSPLELDKTYSRRISDRILDRIEVEDCIEIELKTSYRKKKLLEQLMNNKPENT